MEIKNRRNELDESVSAFLNYLLMLGVYLEVNEHRPEKSDPLAKELPFHQSGI